MRSKTDLVRALLPAAALASVLVSVISLAAGARPGPPQGGAPFEARVDGFLRQSGYDYRKVKANSWYVNMRGKD